MFIHSTGSWAARCTTHVFSNKTTPEGGLIHTNTHTTKAHTKGCTYGRAWHPCECKAQSVSSSVSQSMSQRQHPEPVRVTDRQQHICLHLFGVVQRATANNNRHQHNGSSCPWPTILIRLQRCHLCYSRVWPPITPCCCCGCCWCWQCCCWTSSVGGT